MKTVTGWRRPSAGCAPGRGWTDDRCQSTRNATPGWPAGSGSEDGTQACAGSALVGSRAALVATSQVPLDLGRDRVPLRLGLALVAALLQGTDVGGDVTVLGGQIVHLGLPGGCLLGQVTGVQWRVQQVFEAIQQGHRGLRVG